jgi:hypothetical protein
MLKHLFSTALDYDGLVYVRGYAAATGHLYVEQLHGDEDWLAQYGLNAQGEIVCRSDEADERAFQPLTIPEELARPARLTYQDAYAIPIVRLRGDRAAERIDEVVYPLTIEEKFWLGERLRIAPPLLLGIAGRELVAQGVLPDDGATVVCVKSWVAQALPEAGYDVATGRYTYDSSVVYSLHRHDQADELRLDAAMQSLGGIRLRQPMDVLATADRLFVVEGAGADGVGWVHGWGWVGE